MEMQLEWRSVFAGGGEGKTGTTLLLHQATYRSVGTIFTIPHFERERLQWRTHCRNTCPWKEEIPRLHKSRYGRPPRLNIRHQYPTALSRDPSEGLRLIEYAT